jgi:curved DNA-binding protein CbpA
MEERNNYYEVLEIPVNATFEQIQQAYNSALIAYSEDSVAIYSLMSTDDCKMFRNKIEEAYSILGHPEKRRAYDQQRGFVSHTSNTFTDDQKSKIPKFNFEEEVVSLNASGNEDFGREQRPKSQQAVLHVKNNSAVDVEEARKKFALNYALNDELENRIAHCQEFDGIFLKEIREYKNVTLEKMSEMTRIMKTYLVYIENNDYAKLPATAYIRGFIFQYAKHLKLNTDLVANSYVQKVKQSRGELAKAN